MITYKNDDQEDNDGQSDHGDGKPITGHSHMYMYTYMYRPFKWKYQILKQFSGQIEHGDGKPYTSLILHLQVCQK